MFYSFYRKSLPEETWSFWDAYTSWTGAQRLLRQKWRRLNTLLVMITVLVSLVASLIGMSSIHIRIRFQVDYFSNCVSSETSTNGFQSDFIRKQLVLQYFLIKPHRFAIIVSWTHNSLNCWRTLPFWRHRNFTIISAMCFLVCSLNVPIIFSQRVFFYRLMSFFNAIKLPFVLFCVFWLKFFAISDI